MPGDDWDRHWDQYAESAAQNPAQALRRKLILSLIAPDDAPSRVLDIGCGQGDLIADLQRAYPTAELCGIDVSETGIQEARSKVPGASFLQRDLLSGDEPPVELRGWASHAVCSEVLEHVDDPQRLLLNARQYLAPGCRLIVTVPGGPRSAFDRHIGHRKHFKVEELGPLLAAAGYEPQRVAGVGFPFFNLYRLAVIQRGDRLVADVARGSQASSSKLARLVMRIFQVLFTFNLPGGRFGWQIVAVAHRPQDPPGRGAP